MTKMIIRFRPGAMRFLARVWCFLRPRKKYWLLPAILMTALFGGLIVLTQSIGWPPFIYTVEQAK